MQSDFVSNLIALCLCNDTDAQSSRSLIGVRGLADPKAGAPVLLLAAGSGTKARVQRKAIPLYLLRQVLKRQHTKIT